MEPPWNMYQLELEELDATIPSVDCSAWLNIRIVEHTLDIACINFDSKILTPMM